MHSIQPHGIDPIIPSYHFLPKRRIHTPWRIDWQEPLQKCYPTLDNDDMMPNQRRKKRRRPEPAIEEHTRYCPKEEYWLKKKMKASTPSRFPCCIFFFFIFLISWICHEAQTDQHKLKIKEINWVEQSTHLGQSRHPVHLTHPVIISHSWSDQFFCHHNDWHGHILIAGLWWVC